MRILIILFLANYWDCTESHGDELHVCDDGEHGIEIDLHGDKDWKCFEPSTWPINSWYQEIQRCYPSEHAYHVCINKDIDSLYKATIPHSGPHREVWAKYGEYNYLPPGRYVHNLEHDAVVFMYHPCASPQMVDKLRQVATSCLSRYIITAFPKLNKDYPFAVVTYGCVFQMSTVNPSAIKNWVRGRFGKSPEPDVYGNGKYTHGLLKPAPEKESYDYDDPNSPFCPDTPIDSNSKENKPVSDDSPEKMEPQEVVDMFSNPRMYTRGSQSTTALTNVQKFDSNSQFNGGVGRIHPGWLRNSKFNSPWFGRNSAMESNTPKTFTDSQNPSPTFGPLLGRLPLKNIHNIAGSKNELMNDRIASILPSTQFISPTTKGYVDDATTDNEQNQINEGTSAVSLYLDHSDSAVDHDQVFSVNQGDHVTGRNFANSMPGNSKNISQDGDHGQTLIGNSAGPVTGRNFADFTPGDSVISSQDVGGSNGYDVSTNPTITASNGSKVFDRENFLMKSDGGWERGPGSSIATHDFQISSNIDFINTPSSHPADSRPEGKAQIYGISEDIEITDNSAEDDAQTVHSKKPDIGSSEAYAMRKKPDVALDHGKAFDMYSEDSDNISPNDLGEDDQEDSNGVSPGGVALPTITSHTAYPITQPVLINTVSLKSTTEKSPDASHWSLILWIFFGVVLYTVGIFTGCCCIRICTKSRSSKVWSDQESGNSFNIAAVVRKIPDLSKEARYDSYHRLEADLDTSDDEV